MRASRLFLALACVASGCVRTTFVQTDPSYVLRPSAPVPGVFIDRLPVRPYHSVGIIEVIVPAGLSLDHVIAAAVERANQVGCDALVDRAIYRVAARETDEPIITRVDAVPPPPPQPTPPSYSPPPSSREFICGVYDDAPTQAAALR
jgi:hypothetical protein